MNLWYLVAANGKINPKDIGVDHPVTNAQATLNSILTTVYIWAGIIAVLVIIVAGIIYAGSQGDAGRLTRAKTIILEALAGLVIIIMAFVITQFVLGRF